METSTDLQPWPARLWVVRHGQSAGNVARDLAEAGRMPLIDIQTRDADTPLSEVGHQQSTALGRWFARMPRDERPEFVLASPYVRAHQTARAIAAALDLAPRSPTLRIDERLREKEFGILDRYTVHGIRAKFPELDELRRRVGKFYFRPPGGESWCDVILRLRGITDMLAREYPGRRVVVVAHQVIVSCFRYLLEYLDEAAVLAIDRAADVPNCSVTSYRYDRSWGPRGGMRLEAANVVAPVERSEAPVTAEADAPQGPR
jgi:broad specificity phosphatase PhoE